MKKNQPKEKIGKLPNAIEARDGAGNVLIRMDFVQTTATKNGAEDVLTATTPRELQKAAKAQLKNIGQ